MTAIWMGLSTVEKEQSRIEMTGDREIAATMQTWLGLSHFATAPRRVA